MATNPVPPVPFGAEITGEDGLLVPVWADFFKQLLQRVGGNTGAAHIEADQLATTIAGDGLDGGNGTALSVTNFSTKSLAASGYCYIYNGLYLQWGSTAAVTSGSTQPVTLPQTMPTGLLHAFAGIIDNSAVATTSTGQWGTGNESTTGFDIYNRTSVTLTFNWFAIGY